MHGTAFSDVLDQALGVLAAAEPPLPNVPPTGRAAPPHPFLFATPPFWNHAQAAAPMTADARPAAASPEPPRAPRAMTPARLFAELSGHHRRLVALVDPARRLRH